MKKRVSKKLVWLCLAVVFTLTLTSAASAQPGEFVKGILQPLKDGFPKRTITLVNSDEAGSNDGIYARSIQAALKGISPVDIVVSDEQTASWGTFVKLRDVLTREGGADGYYNVVTDLWGAATDPLAEPITEELGLDISDMQVVIITEWTPDLLVQRAKAPWGPTWAGFLKYAKANPGKLKRTISSAGSATDISAMWILQHFGLKVKTIAQAETEQALASVGAGEADFTVASTEDAQPHLEAGRMVPIMVLGPKVPPPWDKDPNVISQAQAGLPPLLIGSPFGFSVPKQVPTTHVNWLYKLFKAATSTALYKQREKMVVGLQVTIMDPTQANLMKYKYVEMGDPLLRSLGLHVDQRKK